MTDFEKGRVYGSVFSSLIINILYVSFSGENFLTTMDNKK